MQCKVPDWKTEREDIKKTKENILEMHTILSLSCLFMYKFSFKRMHIPIICYSLFIY